MEGLKIISGGKLLRTTWVYDEDTDVGSYVTDDVTNVAPSCLFDACTLNEDVILRDVFYLLERHLDVFQIILNKWLSEIVEEGLRPFLENETEIKYVELYWSVEHSQEDKTLSGNIFPEFHGIGTSAEIPISLMFTPTNEIAGLPLKLCDEFKIYPSITENEGRQTHSYKGPQFSLGQILYGIIWELTWLGSPTERDQKGQELLTAKAEVLSFEDNRLTSNEVDLRDQGSPV